MTEKKAEFSSVNVNVIDKLSLAQQNAVNQLQELAFTVDEEEVKQDFYHPESAHILAYQEGELVGWSGIHLTHQTFNSKPINLGGYGICTHPDRQGQGIASLVSKTAMEFLHSANCDIAFLSVDPSNQASIKLHQKNGFVMLLQQFSWINSLGELKLADGGMIAPINSQKKFEEVLQSATTLHVGDGYW